MTSTHPQHDPNSPCVVVAVTSGFYPMVCPLCGLVMETAEIREDWHGLRKCSNICALCDGEGKHKGGKKCARCKGTGVEIREIGLER